FSEWTHSPTKRNQMKRRDWFKLTALAGGALAMDPFAKASAAGSFLHPLDDLSAELARLSYNENPYGPSKNAREAIVKSFGIAHQYPFQYISEFTAKLATKLGV